MRALSGLLCRRFSTALRGSVPGYVFDIDGVLVRGKTPIPAGRDALRALLKPGSREFRYPVMFLTNSGGVTESQKAEEVSKLCGIEISPDQVVLSHTPMRAMAEEYNSSKDSVIVCVGKRACVHVAGGYGFKRAILIDDFAIQQPLVTPNTMLEGEGEPIDESLTKLKVSAVFLMHDSRNWGRDIQLLCDILGSDGSVHRPLHPHQVVPLYVANPDFVFVNEYHLPRFAQGAFLTALEAVFLRRFGRPLAYNMFGKPHKSQYEFVERLLLERARSMGFADLETIYGIGDNPEADVRGANNAGGKWVSVLVRTGCFEGEGNDASDPAQIVAADAHEAIMTTIQQRRATAV